MNADDLRRLCRTHDQTLRVEAVFKMPDGTLAPLFMTVQEAYYLPLNGIMLRSKPDGPRPGVKLACPRCITVGNLGGTLREVEARGDEMDKLRVYLDVLTWTAAGEDRHVRSTIVGHQTHNHHLVLLAERCPGNVWPPRPDRVAEMARYRGEN